MTTQSKLPGLIYDLKKQLDQQLLNLGTSVDPVCEAEKKGYRDALKYAIGLAENYAAMPAAKYYGDDR